MAVEQMISETFYKLAENTVIVFLAAQTAGDIYLGLKLKKWWDKQ
jgi:hypothetical protein